MKQNTTKQPDSKEGLHTQAEAALISLLNILDGGLDVTVKSKSQAHADFETLKNERKALLDSRAELAKALQYIKKDGHKLLQMYADSEDKNNAYVFATFRAAVGQFIEKSEQVLKEAGLTDK